MTRVLIVGGGFAGYNAAKILGGADSVDVTLIDKHNYHLFQPLLYQVATAGLSPADIAAPIRSMLSEITNIKVLLGEMGSVKLSGFVAWAAWLAVHIYYLTGFKNRLLVVLEWAWSCITFDRGARLIVGKDWKKS